MKATLEFDLLEERAELQLALRAGELSAALSNLDQALRARLKYTEHLTEDERTFLESLRAEIGEALRD